MKTKYLFLALATLALTALLIGGIVSSNATACPEGQCEPIMKWVFTDKVNVPENHLVCPTGDSAYTSNDDDKDCKKKINNHWKYADKVSVLVDHWVCPAGSERDDDKCKMKVQDGWNCNCGNQIPDGNGNCITPPVMCTIEGLENLEADDPLCVEPPVMCTIEGLENLEADDPLCVEPPVMCTIEGLENLEADDPLCVEPPLPPVPPVFYDVCVNGVSMSVNQNDLESYSKYPRGVCKVVPVTGGDIPGPLYMLWQWFLSLFN
jgi:hypothetical protein